MATLEELKRENERLKNIDQAKEEIRQIDKERLILEKENRALRNPKKVRFVKKITGGVKDLGKGLLWGMKTAGTQYAKSQASREPQKRRVRKKKGSKVKRVRKVKRSNFGSQFGLEPRFSFN